jgi:hypothetical protein
MSSITFKYGATDYCNLAAERVLTGIYVRNNHRESVRHKLKRQTLKVTIIYLFFWKTTGDFGAVKNLAISGFCFLWNL